MKNFVAVIVAVVCWGPLATADVDPPVLTGNYQLDSPIVEESPISVMSINPGRYYGYTYVTEADLTCKSSEKDQKRNWLTLSERGRIEVIEVHEQLGGALLKFEVESETTVDATCRCAMLDMMCTWRFDASKAEESRVPNHVSLLERYKMGALEYKDTEDGRTAVITVDNKERFKISE